MSILFQLEDIFFFDWRPIRATFYWYILSFCVINCCPQKRDGQYHHHPLERVDREKEGGVVAMMKQPALRWVKGLLTRPLQTLGLGREFSTWMEEERPLWSTRHQPNFQRSSWALAGQNAIILMLLWKWLLIVNSWATTKHTLLTVVSQIYYLQMYHWTC